MSSREVQTVAEPSFLIQREPKLAPKTALFRGKTLIILYKNTESVYSRAKK